MKRVIWIVAIVATQIACATTPSSPTAPSAAPGWYVMTLTQERFAGPFRNKTDCEATLTSLEAAKRSNLSSFCRYF